MTSREHSGKLVIGPDVRSADNSQSRGEAIEQARHVLRERFGLSAFRPGQEAAMQSALAGRSLLVVMPTGSGKSLLFQLPALMDDGMTLVVSPLIALMKDQVDELVRKGIAATYVNSSLALDEQQRRLRECIAGRVDLLYVAPERFRSGAFLNMLRRAKISRMAVDEAHCISEWGHDFRPDYRRLNTFRADMNAPRVTALTATATPRVQNDIIKSLGLSHDEVDMHVHGFDRPNLLMSVVRARGAEQKNAFVCDFLAEQKGAGIIYTGTRRAAEDVAEAIREIEPKVVVYHAGLEPELRTRSQEDFLGGKARLVVATVAFGMGIDKADVRFVIHYNYPGSVEQYYQEIGRAGRDGLPSQCVLLYSPADRGLREFFIDLSYPSRQQVMSVYKALWSVDENPVLMTHRDVAKLCDKDVRDGQVGAALRLLAEAEVVRYYDREAPASVELQRPGAEILPEIRGRVQRQVFESLSSTADLASPGWYRFGLEDLCRAAGLADDHVRRALAALHEGGFLEYHPPFRGRGVQKLVDKAPPFGKLSIDWKRQEHLRGIEEKKLENMEAYIHTKGCRREFVVRYFGEKEKPACDNCDHCKKRGRRAGHDEEDEDVVVAWPELAVPILTCVGEMRFPLGLGKVAQVVTGSRDKDVLKWRLNRNPAYGALSVKQHTVKRVIEQLTQQGYLREEGEPGRPVLTLTMLGEQALDFAAERLPARSPSGALPFDEPRPAARKPARARSPAKGPHEPSSREDIQAAALECVAALKRPLGLRNVAAILTGSSAKAVIKAGGDKLDVYDTIAATQVEVQKAIQGLVRKGLFCYGGTRQYPVLELTDVGRQILDEDAFGDRATEPARADVEPATPDAAHAGTPAPAQDSRVAEALDALLAEITRCERDRAKAHVEALRLFHPAEIARRMDGMYNAAENLRERSRIVWVVGELCGAEGLPLLVAWADSRETNVRRLAASAIGKILDRLRHERSGAESCMADAARTLAKLSQEE